MAHHAQNPSIPTTPATLDHATEQTLNPSPESSGDGLIPEPTREDILEQLGTLLADIDTLQAEYAALQKLQTNSNR